MLNTEFLVIEIKVTNKGKKEHVNLPLKSNAVKNERIKGKFGIKFLIQQKIKVTYKIMQKFSVQLCM